MSDSDNPNWTPEQVESANGFQRAGFMHPFTCGNGCGADLVAHADGWHCPTTGCGYRQTWAHGFMLDGSWRAMDTMAEARKAARAQIVINDAIEAVRNLGFGVVADGTVYGNGVWIGELRVRPLGNAPANGDPS